MGALRFMEYISVVLVECTTIENRSDLSWQKNYVRGLIHNRSGAFPGLSFQTG